jgi:hypothetical protein
LLLTGDKIHEAHLEAEYINGVEKEAPGFPGTLRRLLAFSHLSWIDGQRVGLQFEQTRKRGAVCKQPIVCSCPKFPAK